MNDDDALSNVTRFARGDGMLESTIKCMTDTSTLCLFDPQCLQHRLVDDADWWSIAEEELAEVNLGHVLFLNLGQDGEYWVTITDEVHNPDMIAYLNVPTGLLYIGAGEDVTADGLEPECLGSGGFVAVSPGHYQVAIRRTDNTLDIALTISDIEKNSFKTLLRLP